MQIRTRAEPAEYDIVQTLGLARGNAVRTRQSGKDVLALLRGLVDRRRAQALPLMQGAADILAYGTAVRPWRRFRAGRLSR